MLSTRVKGHELLPIFAEVPNRTKSGPMLN